MVENKLQQGIGTAIDEQKLNERVASVNKGDVSLSRQDKPTAELDARSYKNNQVFVQKDGTAVYLCVKIGDDIYRTSSMSKV